MENFPAAMITGYDFRTVPELPDPDDRHVLAAAMHGEVDVISESEAWQAIVGHLVKAGAPMFARVVERIDPV